MKKTVYLVSVIFLLISCASLPEDKVKAPVDDSLEKLNDSLEKLLAGKKIQCSFTKGVGIDVEEFDVATSEDEDEEDFDLRLLIKLDPKSDNATIYLDARLNKNIGLPYTYSSKVQRWQDSISLIFDIPGLGPPIITVFPSDADDVLSDYVATLSLSANIWDPLILNYIGSCKIKPQDMKKSAKLKDVSFTIKSVNTYSPLKEPWGEYKVIVDTSTVPNEVLLREIALEIWRAEGTGFHEFYIEFYLPEMDTLGIPYAEAVVGPDGVSSFEFSLEGSPF